ncbi:IS982 family transposase [Legionella londiniensis]|uniref:Membrane-associated, metal-dependent hydrolase n=2 Tax=Gammaproteobacteria TaxID=1236 RepID=A0A0W0VIC7_9GAMM|nr:IS982 family transposase [Legionella londiniensis]KTD19859.1 membrane-associated, metal-dependent hydrolase [Legionella londiniensis]STX92243.1 membrane-associated, metal-dependent hydrolase [Legionella londiniensis]STX94269.1 membrane-associated, metal-dependent hydrolase [Legionella londiniensis]
MLAPIVEIFCDIDDFCKAWFKEMSPYLLPSPNRKRQRPCRLSASEIMTVMILFHLSHYRTFKDYYRECVEMDMKSYFPKLVSYNRFVEIMSSVVTPLSSYLLSHMGKKTGLYYVDSTTLQVCHNKRIHRHKTFAGIAERGKSSMGWFFGFKLHLVINHLGELIAFCITKGNVDDRQPLEQLFKNLHGLAAADKGYLSKKKEESLFQKGVKLITKVRRNMKAKILSTFEKYFLRQRSIVETVIEQLKSICQIEHTRHRKPDNFVINLLSGLAAYMLKPRKPSLKIHSLNKNLGLLMPS